MKTSDLTNGYYYDGKKTLRKLVAREGDQVVFQKVAPCYPQPRDIEILHHCLASEFGKWAKVKLDNETLESVCLDLCCNSTTLTQAQEQALREVQAGAKVSGKVRTSLLEKGLIATSKPKAGDFWITVLGNRILNRLDTLIEKSA